MIELLKKDINVGEVVKLLLTTGKDPIGKLIELGENFVVLEHLNGKKVRYFEKLIGGWEKANLRLKINNANNTDTKKTAEYSNFKKTEIFINQLIQSNQYDSALAKINEELKFKKLESKYKSSLMLKKAQIFSALNNPNLSEKAYQELVVFNEKNGSTTNNLSHLYTELARLQSLDSSRDQISLGSLEKALEYNPRNNYALLLKFQILNKVEENEDTRNSSQDSKDVLKIQTDENKLSISQMLDLDIKKHEFVSQEILESSKVSLGIVKKIFEEAKQIRDVDLEQRFPIYLEAAKAFRELPVGSYDFQDYIESIAYYSMLKGNSLFIKFKRVLNSEKNDVVKLRHLKDSACSYYIESLNLLSNIEPKLLLTILGNYLKLNLAYYYINNPNNVDVASIFKGQFGNILETLVKNKNSDIEEIAYDVILRIGASSLHAWNSLSKIKNGTQRLYGSFDSIESRQKIYRILNNILQADIDSELLPGEFLKRSFSFLKNRQRDIESLANSIIKFEIEPHSIEIILKEWQKINFYNNLFSETDIEIKLKIDKVLLVLKPYLNRNQIERTNILIQANKIIDSLIEFIDENTTFYGRTFFYRLLQNWKRDLYYILDEKISETLPRLEIQFDPPYFNYNNDQPSAPIIIKNMGEVTSEGFFLNITFESTEFDQKETIDYENEHEIPSHGKIQLILDIPNEIVGDSNAVEVKIASSAIYQGNQLPPQIMEFTLEQEPKLETLLSLEQIPWKDGPIPSSQLFKGRRKLIKELTKHYLSNEKDKPYILYGLTRTGKSSVLEYLKQELKNQKILIKGIEKSIITFSWELNEAASFKNATDFWEYMLYSRVYEPFEDLSTHIGIDISDSKFNDQMKLKHFKPLLEYVSSKGFFPVFFVDEFSFIKTLIDQDTINTAFLHSLRQHSISDLASFIFAGTYDIKDLIVNPKYGITGQLVNTIEYQVSEIEDEAAEELIEVIDDKLTFTPEAIGHIKFLSGNVPYFIQIICKNCGYFAVENKRRHIGYPELEKVIEILIGTKIGTVGSNLRRLSETTFQNNQYSPADPKEVTVLISSITHFNRDRITDPRGVAFTELQRLWAENGIKGFNQKLSDAIQLLLEKKIIISKEDEGIQVYRFSVDLFRRWWAYHNPDLNLSLTKLIEE